MPGRAIRRVISNLGLLLVRSSWITHGAIILSAIMLFACLGRPAVAQKAQDLAGTWQGTLPGENGPRIKMQIHKAHAGGWEGEIRSIDTGDSARVETITQQGAVVSFAVPSMEVRYEGKLSADGALISGILTQSNQTTPLNLERATSETEWEIKKSKYMAASAKPAFDVATIKFSKPDLQMAGFMSPRGRHIDCINESLANILKVAYGVHANQIVGVPDWGDSTKYDVSGFPDVPGIPNGKQVLGMYRKLLEDRFHLVMHIEKRTMPAYALTVDKGGPKITRSLDQDGSSETTSNEKGWESRVLRVTSTNMEEFASRMQGYLEKPVVDQTGLAGKWDFLLRWRPDDSPAADANALPGIFTAMSEQLGLKLESVKAPVDVLVIDHVERPSAN